MVNFIKKLFGKLFKDNSFLERGVLTGILRTAKEGIFSGLNNLEVCSLLRDDYADKFGFTQQEVNQLLQDQHINHNIQDIKHWYNGYHAGEKTLIYNPWSIVECARHNGSLEPYWVNTSGNDLIKNLIARSYETVKQDLECILNNKFITKTIEESFTLQHIESNENALLSLFFFSGYITYRMRTLTEDGKYLCSLIIPNHEIKVLYNDLIKSIFSTLLSGSAKVQQTIDAFVTNDANRLGELIQEFIFKSISFYDIPQNESERSYHMFILGLFVSLEDSYIIKSNKESGYGRYDLMFIPKKNTVNPGIIVEFKRAFNQSIDAAADTALKQIHEKQYKQELVAQGINDIIMYGIAFKGKKVLVKSESYKL